MAIKLAVFDMAGTTIADNHAVSDAFRSAFRTRSLEVPAGWVEPLMGYKKPLAIQMILERLGASSAAGEVNEIHEAFVEAMLDHYEFSADVKAMTGAEEAMWELKEEGILIALNTGFSRNIADIIVDRMQWKDMGIIDDYIASDEVTLGRPDPAMIRKLMSRARITDPKQVIKIGDTEVDINEGKNAGCLFTVAVTTGAFTREALEPYQPDYILDSLFELPALIHQHA